MCVRFTTQLHQPTYLVYTAVVIGTSEQQISWNFIGPCFISILGALAYDCINARADNYHMAGANGQMLR